MNSSTRNGSCVVVDMNFSSDLDRSTSQNDDSLRISCSGTFLDQNSGLVVTSGLIFAPLFQLNCGDPPDAPRRKLDLFFSPSGQVLHRDIFDATSASPEERSTDHHQVPSTKGRELIHYIESLCDIRVYVDRASDYYDRQVTNASNHRGNDRPSALSDWTNLLTTAVTGDRKSRTTSAKVKAGDVLNTSSPGDGNNKRWVKQGATILAIWRCNELATVLEDVLQRSNGWSLSDDNPSRNPASRLVEECSRNLLPFFALLKVKPLPSNAGGNVQLERLIRPLQLQKTLDKTVLPFLRSEIGRIAGASQKEGSLELAASLLSRYADRVSGGCRSLLRLLALRDADKELMCVRAQCREALLRVARECRQGSPWGVGCALSVMATPFGALSPSVFINSVSKGIVTNVAGDGNALIMTDARCVPGCEGGGVYLESDMKARELVGIVITPFCWRQNEWVGLTFVAALPSVLGSLFMAAGRSLTSVISRLAQDVDIAGSQLYRGQSLTDNVALIKIGSRWGSAVLVSLFSSSSLGTADRKFLLSCRHVVQCKVGHSVRVRFNRNTETVFDETYVTARVIYCTPEGQIYDLAVLEVDERDAVSLPGGLVLSTKEPAEGDSTLAIGHGLFDENMHLPASITSGIISKILTKNGRQVLIQSTCAVHPGASGGALVNEKTGQVSGIIVCNAKDANCGACYPHVNLSIPSTILTTVLDDYMKSGDVEVLKRFHEVDPDICCYWQLGYNQIGKLPSKL